MEPTIDPAASLMNQIRAQVAWLKLELITQRILAGRLMPRFSFEVMRKILRPETKKVIINLSR